MGSKLSKAVRRPHVHKATASPPAPSHHEAQQTRPCQDQRLPQVTRGDPLLNDAPVDAATSSTQLDNRTAHTADVEMMDAPQPAQPSDEGDNVSLAELPDPLAVHRPPPAPVFPPADTLPPPPPPPPPPALETTLNCLICCTPFPKDKEHTALKPCRCGNAFCAACLKKMFIDACNDMTRMPPRCCNQLPLHHARPHLTNEETALFRAKYEEWSTPKPFYCPVPTCSAFIPSRFLSQTKTNQRGKQRVDSGIGTPTSPVIACPKCEVEICSNCRDFAHPDSTCRSLEFGIDKETAELLKSWGYKRCPKCGNGVKRMFGCNHMECRCGAHFCWVCLKSRDDCDGGCYDDDEEYDSEEEPDTEEEEARAADAGDADAPAAAGDGATQDAATRDAGTGEPAEGASNPPPPSPQPSPRPRNLDGGSGRFWEEQDLDFGQEPTDDIQDRAWDCVHEFKTAKVSLEDSLRNVPSASNMECMKCWHTVHPEIEMPKSINTGGSRTVSADASRARIGTRGITRTRRRGHLPAHDIRFPIFGSLPNSAPQLPFQSQGLPATEPMDGVEYTCDRPEEDDLDSETLIDTYGRVITTTEKHDDQRRASIDVPTLQFADEDEFEKPEWVKDFMTTRLTIPSDDQQDVLDALQSRMDLDGAADTPPPAPAQKKPLSLASDISPFSFAYECRSCGLLVCNTCKENLLSAQ